MTETTCTSTTAGFTHPTLMHSCFMISVGPFVFANYWYEIDLTNKDSPYIVLSVETLCGKKNKIHDSAERKALKALSI